MIKAIVFDMDGTLIDSDELVLNIYQHLCIKYPPKINFDSLDQEIVLASSYPEIIAQLYDDVHNKYLEYIEYLHETLYKHHLKVITDIPYLLKTLKDKGYRIGVFTAEIKKIAHKELSSLGLLTWIDEVICYDDLTSPKPSPEGLFELMKRFSCQSHEMIYFGDQLSDSIAAKAGNILSVLCDLKNNKPIDMKSMYHHVVHDVESILHIINHYHYHVIHVKTGHPLNLLQLTDLHLMNDEKDEKTYQLISDMIHFTHPDFIVMTGDQTMSKDAVSLYQKLGIFMDNFHIPYTFVFGNHDTEENIAYQALIDSISSSKYLWFDQGSKHLGYSNHQIMIKESNRVIGSLVMMDTHVDDFYDIEGKNTWGYGSITDHQIKWYKNITTLYPYPHLIFFHIPIPELKEVTPNDHIHQGDYYENPSTPPVNLGFFDTAKKSGLAKAMFFGHDHLNDYTYLKDDILLAYGRVSGHYDYAMPGFPKGARIITFKSNGDVTTKIILHKDIHRKEDELNES